MYAKRYNLSDDHVGQLIGDPAMVGNSLRAQVGKWVRERTNGDGVRGAGGASGGSGYNVGDDSVEKIREPMVHGLLARAGYAPVGMDEYGKPSHKPLARGFEQFRKMPLMRLATEFARAQGYGDDLRHMSDEEIASAMLNGNTRMARNGLSSMRAGVTVEDFPTMLNVVVNQVLQSYTVEQEREWLAGVRVVQANDFRPRVVKTMKADGLLGEASSIGEFPLMQHEATSDSWKISIQGIKFIITLEAMLGDDLGALMDVPMEMQRGQFETERLKFYDFLDDAGLMHDSLPLFHATHKNLATVDITRGDFDSIDAAVEAANIRMMNQTMSVKGQTPIRRRARMKTIFCDTKEQRLVGRLTTNQVISNAENPAGFENEWAKMGLQVVAMPDIGKKVVIFADPREFPCIEAGWLFGEQSLRIQSKTVYTGLSTETVGWTAFGMGRVGWIGVDKTTVVNP